MSLESVTIQIKHRWKCAEACATRPHLSSAHVRLPLRSTQFSHCKCQIVVETQACLSVYSSKYLRTIEENKIEPIDSTARRSTNAESTLIEWCRFHVCTPGTVKYKMTIIVLIFYCLQNKQWGQATSSYNISYSPSP